MGDRPVSEALCNSPDRTISTGPLRFRRHLQIMQVKKAMSIIPTAANPIAIPTIAPVLKPALLPPVAGLAD
ncbi:hypothetical protein FVEN_g12917 [Fusarium venenatum]|nr:hypothetical protein FVEN_g12917 [Fusarium venenatum]